MKSRILACILIIACLGIISCGPNTTSTTPASSAPPTSPTPTATDTVVPITTPPPTVTPPSPIPPGIVVQSIDVNPKEVIIGEPSRVTIVIANTGNAEVVYRPELVVDGSVDSVYTPDLTLKPGGIQTITMFLAKHDIGTAAMHIFSVKMADEARDLIVKKAQREVPVKFELNPVSCVNGKVTMKPILTENQGVSVTFKALTIYYQGGEGQTSERVILAGEDFRKAYPNAYLKPNQLLSFTGTHDCNFITSVWTFTGISDTGESVRATGRVNFRIEE